MHKIIYICVHACTYMHTEMFELYNVTCIYVFRDDHLILDNQLIYM